jgi:hypothetical protein
MDDLIRRFLEQMDAALAPAASAEERLDRYHIGRSALILHYGARGLSTKDFDVVWMPESELEDKAEELFGKGTARAREIGLYLDRVPQGLPPLPQRFRKRCTLIPGSWRVLRLWELEPHDYAATKLKSFRPQDRQDVQFLCDAGLLRPEELRASLESAFLWTAEKDGDEDRERAFAHLAKVIDYLEGRSRSM